MRKAQKAQLEEYIALLGEAHQEIVNAVKDGDVALAGALLEQCQNTAVAAGNMIAELEGEGHKTVSCLDCYCEVLFRVYGMAAGSITGSNNVAEVIEAELRDALEKIHTSVVEDITVRREVVFLPYNASMWDSLESVWKAADEDPDCDAYVVPIPYFDKYPGGGFKEFHYEGNEYPEYVPITDYHTYDFATRKPDMVFIHNPYDDCNYVTSIHPKFYAENLKKYTDKLVYIPYFILDEPDPDKFSEITEEGKEKLQGFCIQPGVLQSDVVIVQSEAMKQLYIYILTDHFGEHTRPIWEKKILGLGSPKMDKVANTTDADFEVPEEWKKVLYDAEGCMKKVILYNTSVGALLKHDEAMLAKMRRVFETFYENREDVALLWRPHPLIKSTIESMRPQLWKEYEKLVKEYREAGWGIYDDTKELNRAIELADAYYGDPSSLVQLCRENGIKIIRIQDVEEDEENNLMDIKNKNHLLHPEMIFSVRKDEYLYYFAWNCNAFMRIELETGNVEYLGSLPEEQDNIHMIRTVDYYGKYIVFCPGNLRKDYWYDTERKYFIDLSKRFCIEQKNKNGLAYEHTNKTNAVSSYARTGGKLWTFPLLFDGDVVCFDLKESRLSRERQVLIEYAKVTLGEMSLFSTSNVFEYQNKLYLALAQTNHIVEFCPKNKTAKFYEVAEIQVGVRQLCGNENNLFLLTHDKRILQWNIDTKVIEWIWDIDWDEQKEFTRLQSCTCWNNEVYFWGIGVPNGCFCSFGIKLNVITREVKTFTYEEEFGLQIMDGENFSYSSMDENRNFYFVSNYHRIFIYNAELQHSQMIHLKYGIDVKIRNIKQRSPLDNKYGNLCYKRSIK